jgi:hypothetical protein
VAVYSRDSVTGRRDYKKICWWCIDWGTVVILIVGYLLIRFGAI